MQSRHISGLYRAPPLVERGAVWPGGQFVLSVVPDVDGFASVTHVSHCFEGVLVVQRVGVPDLTSHRFVRLVPRILSETACSERNGACDPASPAKLLCKVRFEV